MSKIRRINLLGPPCCGKSTMAAIIFSEMKKMHYEVEKPSEFVKEWTFLNRNARIGSHEQTFIFGSQQNLEEIRLLAGIDYVICECPIILNTFYAKMLKCPVWQEHYEMCKKYELDYPSINIWLDRNMKKEEYKQNGRFQTYEEMLALNEQMHNFLKEFCGEQLVDIRYNDEEAIMKYILEKIK